jgi:hypothetical protein
MAWLGMLIKRLNIIALNVLIKKSSFYWNRDITLAAGTPKSASEFPLNPYSLKDRLKK